MVEAILLQIPPPVREALQVCAAYHCNRLVYAEHVLLHCLIIPLLNLIQSPYHGIIVALVTKCLLHVHQQVPHGDIFALIQHAGSFARVPTEAGEDVGAHASLIILLEEGIHIEVPERVHHLGPWISQLKDQHMQSHRHQPFPLPTPSVAPVPMPVACSLTRSGVFIRVRCPLVQGEGGQTPPPTVVHWDFSGLPCSCAAPVRVVSLASVTSSTPEALPTCCGALPTSWPEESDPLAAMTGILWTGFSTRPLSLWWSEAATDCHHAFIRVKRVMVKWRSMRSTLKKPPPHGSGQHLWHPAPKPNSPACHKRTGKQYPGHLLAHAPAP